MITIDTLVSQCLANRENPKNFRILYNQLLHRQHVEPAELFRDLSSTLTYYYIFEIFNYDIGISKLFAILVTQPVEVQSNFFKLLLQEQDTVIVDSDMEENFNMYLNTLFASDDGQEKAEKLVIEVTQFVTHQKLTVTQDSLSQLLDISARLKLNLLPKQEAIFSSKHINVTKFLRVKKFIWLNYKIANYELQDHLDEFVTDFMKLVDNTSWNYVLTELLATSFEAMNIVVSVRSTNETLYLNWEYFILNKLPLVMNKNFKTNNENFELILEKSISILQDFNLRANFLKSLVSMKLIKLEKLYHYLGGFNTSKVIEINELLKYQNEAHRESTKFEESNFIQEIINKNLLEINPEFTTIDDDNKLYSFLAKFNLNNLQLKAEFAKVISKTIVQLCDDKDSTRLRRLLLCLSSNLSTLDVFMFNTDVRLILNKLIEICCNSDYLNESGSANQDVEDISMFGDDGDDENFQELYSDFSCIFMHILFLLKRYDIEIPTTNPFILKLLGSFQSMTPYVSSADESKLKNLQEWYESIYNDNESLISDDLIAKTNLVNSFQLIPIIFNQSMIAHENGQINTDLVLNGFEFFMQPVLIINLISIFRKLDQFLWLKNDTPLVWQICNKILTLKLEGESELMFKLIWNYLSPDLQHWKTFNLEATNSDYAAVMKFLSGPEDQQSTTTGSQSVYETVFIDHLNSLMNWNVTTGIQPYQLSVYKAHTFEYYKIFDKLVQSIGSISNFAVENLNDDKNLNFLNFLEISSFALLILFKFDKDYIQPLTQLMDNTDSGMTQTFTNKLLCDLAYLRSSRKDAFYQNCGTKLMEKVLQHLSSL